jgi:hypothetical protein
MEKCPICGKESEDMRHVGVECLYEVNEFVPSAVRETVLSEVPEGKVYLAKTKHFPAGTVDELFVSEVKGNTTVLKVKQVPVPAVRLLEKSLFNVSCCKRCRGDFLRLFKAWSEGKHIEKE